MRANWRSVTLQCADATLAVILCATLTDLQADISLSVWILPFSCCFANGITVSIPNFCGPHIGMCLPGRAGALIFKRTGLNHLFTRICHSPTSMTEARYMSNTVSVAVNHTKIYFYCFLRNIGQCENRIGNRV